MTREPGGRGAGTTRRKGQLKTYVVAPHADGGWKVRTEGASRATSVHRTKPEAVAAAKEPARGKAPSQLLVYKKDGSSVQEEQTGVHPCHRTAPLVNFSGNRMYRVTSRRRRRE